MTRRTLIVEAPYLREEIKELEQERDYWRKMYTQEAEQCNRFEAEYKRVYQELQMLKADKEEE